jgi:hypothetical protein
LIYFEYILEEYWDMTNTLKKTKRKPRAKEPVTLIVEREFVGGKTLAEAMLPVIFEDLRRRTEDNRTFDNGIDSA